MNALKPDSQKQIQKWVHTALRSWYAPSTIASESESPLILIQEKLSSIGNSSPMSIRLATNEVLEQHLDLLQQSDSVAADLLMKRFLDREILQDVANQMNLSVDQVKRLQRDALLQLSQLIHLSETDARKRRQLQMEAALEAPTYAALFGVDRLQQQLTDWLLSDDLPGITAVVGIGGIGKTALTDAVVRRVIPAFRFSRVVWVRYDPTLSAQQDQGSQLSHTQALNDILRAVVPQSGREPSVRDRIASLRNLLKSTPMLIVIDNIEVAADAGAILPLLQDLANPSQFLLTTRSLPDGRLGVRTLTIPELTMTDSAALIRHHAHQIQFTDLAQADDATVGSIYDLVGGNPLAIKLVVSLAAVYPLADILEDFRQLHIGEVESLYRHIYWRSWQSLTPESRALLEIMPMAAQSGMGPEQMTAVSGLTKKELWPAIEELVRRSLLEVRGTTWKRRYTIHRLTEAFLRTEIIHWPEGDG